MKKGFELWFCHKMAILCLLTRRHDMAVHYWERARGIAPHDARIVSSIAHTRAEQGRAAEAAALFRQSLDLDPAQPATWFNLGFLLEEAGDSAEAAAAFRRAVELDGKLDRAWYGLALALIKSGQVEEAVTALKRNTELQPMSPYGWYQLAHAYLRLGQRDKAEGVVHRLARFEPKVALQLEQETGIKAGVNLPTGRF
ncbi:Tfp pilus assembly protein PilF-like protein [Paramagnetospirillum caucaseum]|uniref:Tfp pilus assembly protein PilF-like protein n=1 Tax=Paramagnetospirillum caucaseum TaxID=1244869 RepID=M2YFU5_9PROT|nr:tetratricopeptide repeat protein [Paramagnetospirillum caucaseum]EME72006.1 Tfp pilus assembly protein PilF-like protein [Paramagnetospirillum caucaseum]